MEAIVSFLTNFAVSNPVLILVLWGVSEGLSLLPGIKANGIFQLLGHILAGLKDSLKLQVVAPKAPEPPK